jgi:hypothetical protein
MDVITGVDLHVTASKLRTMARELEAKAYNLDRIADMVSTCSPTWLEDVVQRIIARPI